MDLQGCEGPIYKITYYTGTPVDAKYERESAAGWCFGGGEVGIAMTQLIVSLPDSMYQVQDFSGFTLANLLLSFFMELV